MPPVTAVGLARVIGGVAIVFVGATGALASGFSPLAIPFILYALVPYGVLAAAARYLVTNPWSIGGAGVAALTVEAGIRAAVMVWPRGSTAAIALVFSPVFIMTIAMPAGAALGWAMGYVFERTGIIIRGLATTAAIGVLALTFIYFARPELFPTNVRARTEALAAIGEPRVVAGGDRFVSAVLNETAGWNLVGEYDGQPGDDVAIVDHKGAQLFDVATMARTRFIPFGGDPGRAWGPFSRLVRSGDSFVVANTGGGFSSTEVKSLDNVVLWTYRPDPKLAPSAMLPGDLDEDGEAEYYASTTDAIVRLTAAGTVVWTKPVTLSDLVALVPRRGTEPAWLVSARYDTSVDIWNVHGESVAQVAWPGARVHGVVDWPSARHILAGETTVKGVDLKGGTQFEMPIDEGLFLTDAVVWKPSADAPPLLAVVSGGDPDLHRWRLRLYETPEKIVYDEVFEKPISVLAAHAATGAGTLLIDHSTHLSVLRPR